MELEAILAVIQANPVVLEADEVQEALEVVDLVDQKDLQDHQRRYKLVEMDNWYHRLQVVQNTIETPQLQIIEKSVEFPATRSAQSAHTSVSFDAFPVVMGRAQPAPVDELVAPTPAISCAAPTPVDEYIAPEPS